MPQICKGNFDYDGDVDGTDASIFKQHYGRSEYNNPCPPDGPSPVEKTLQTICYDEGGTQISCSGTGQDGEYQIGVILPEPRFIDHEDGTVTDNLTGLMWAKDAKQINETLWSEAVAYCNNLELANYSDWRLPNVKELLSLLDYGYDHPSLPVGHPFIDVINGEYWSSTTYLSGDYARSVHLGHGDSTSGEKIVEYYHVWPVRGGH